jgi:hypothetical protein
MKEADETVMAIRKTPMKYPSRAPIASPARPYSRCSHLNGFAMFLPISSIP